MQISYRDITEVNGVNLLTADLLKTYEALVRTPLAFINFARRAGYCNVPKVSKVLEDAGWEHVTSCLNWHNAHNGDCEMLLWLKKFEKNLPVDKGYGRAHSYSEHLSFLGGCGGRIIEPHEIEHPDIKLVNATYWPRFLTLLRVPTDKSVDAAYLRAMNYRPLTQFSTSMADYWVNGFKDWTRDAEMEFWVKWKKPAALSGEKRATLKQV